MHRTESGRGLMATSQLLVPIFCGGLVAWALLMARRLFLKCSARRPDSQLTALVGRLDLEQGDDQRSDTIRRSTARHGATAPPSIEFEAQPKSFGLRE